MTRAEFIKKVAEDSNSTHVASKLWTEAVLDSLADALITEDVVAIRKLGTFEHIDRAPKVGRNSSTGERIDIPAKKIIKFTPCDRIADLVATEPTIYDREE